MSYRIDKNNENAIVFSGHSQGIAQSPYEGISDMRNLNIVSIPDEASVNFATSQISPPIIANGTVSSADNSTHYLTYTGASGLENNMAIQFNVSGLTLGSVSAATTYWITNLNGAGAGTFTLSSTYPVGASSTLVNVTNGVGTFTVSYIGKNLITGSTNDVPKFFAYDSLDQCYFMLTTSGALWSNIQVTTSGYWTYMGASGTADTNAGQGLVYYQASDGTRWVFVFNSETIDYFDLVALSWTYGWNPGTGTTHQTAYLKTNGSVPTAGHKAILAPDNKIYYCDSNWIGRWYQAASGTPFVPTTQSTYIFDQTPVLPYNQPAQCLAVLGNNVLIGSTNNIIYSWNTINTLPNFPLFISESNVPDIVTVNTNAYILAGNRGRVYISNGSQADFYCKLPDHLSGTVEPYYTWGGITSNKNQLYFSALVTTNAGTATNTMGGVWAIDLGGMFAEYQTGHALRMVNQLSYGTYAGYATCLIPNFTSSPAGTGIYIGWQGGSSDLSPCGIDGTISTPYTGSQAYIDYDLVPIATLLIPKVFKTVEYKLAVPLVSGESVSIQYRTEFDAPFTNIFTSSTVGIYSDYSPVNFDNTQWIQLRAVLNSTASSPSFVRLLEIRLK